MSNSDSQSDSQQPGEAKKAAIRVKYCGICHKPETTNFVRHAKMCHGDKDLTEWLPGPGG